MALKARPLRLVVTGVESTGKTTLARAIAQHFGFPLALEVARFDQAVRHGNLEAHDLDRLAELQFNAALEAEQRALKSRAGGLISDTGGLVLEIWGTTAFETVPKGSRDLQRWFDFYILCTPDIPWEPDPLRSLPHHEDRMALHQAYIQRLHAGAYHWVETQGSAPKERFLSIVQAIEMAMKRHINE